SYTQLTLESWQKLERGEELPEAEWMEYLNKPWGFQGNSPVHYNFAEHCLHKNSSDEAYHGSKEATHLPCFAERSLHVYMNRKDVQAALHVTNRLEMLRPWSENNDDMVFTYNRTNNVLPAYKDILALAKSPFRMLIYHGDTDLMLSPMATVFNTRKIAAESNRTELPYSSWHFFDDYAGARTSYKNDVSNVTMDVLTVRGAGHGVPTDLSAQAFQMINNFLFTDDSKPIDYSEPIRKH
ncbi:hypothetical protein PFISCL1PPCAC_5160, partial [Pristionchus fissidentatus]